MWVFGYGSLMWRPGFDFEERAKARAMGYRRCFCIQSVHHRGNENRSGLVLGLDQGGACEGIAFRIAPSKVNDTLSYLRAREQVNGVYREAHIPLSVVREVGTADDSWETVTGVAYLAERAHPSYAGRLPLIHQARQICGARGLSGDNLDYFINTLEHLAELGIRERELERLATVIGGYVCGAGLREKSGDGSDTNRSRARVRALSRAVAAKHPARALRLRPDQRRRFIHRGSVFGGR